MQELNQSTLKKVAKILNATLLTHTTAQTITEPLDTLACSYGVYGLNAKLWQGKKTKQFFYATNYSTMLYRF